MQSLIQIGQGVTALCRVENGFFPLLWPVAYTTACTTVQAVIMFYFLPSLGNTQHTTSCHLDVFQPPCITTVILRAIFQQSAAAQLAYT